MAKKRTAVPAAVLADVMLASDSTCCHCRTRGKAVQLHHLDEDPSNNNISNLAVLCLECHNQTQVSGGFGRTLSEPIVRKYRDEWHTRVESRRDEADKNAISLITEAGAEMTADTVEIFEYSEKRATERLRFVNALPELGRQLRNNAQVEWDSGVTSRMVNGSYDYINSLKGLLVQMARFYPDGTFDDPQTFFSEQVASRFRWHRSYAVPDGPGTAGTIVNVTVSGAVVDDVEKMVEEMAMALVGYDDRFDWRNWPKLWEGRQSKSLHQTKSFSPVVVSRQAALAGEAYVDTKRRQWR